MLEIALGVFLALVGFAVLNVAVFFLLFLVGKGWFDK